MNLFFKENGGLVVLEVKCPTSGQDKELFVCKYYSIWLSVHQILLIFSKNSIRNSRNTIDDGFRHDLHHFLVRRRKSH